MKEIDSSYIGKRLRDLPPGDYLVKGTITLQGDVIVEVPPGSEAS